MDFVDALFGTTSPVMRPETCPEGVVDLGPDDGTAERFCYRNGRGIRRRPGVGTAYRAANPGQAGTGAPD